MTFEEVTCKLCGWKHNAHGYQIPAISRNHLRKEHPKEHGEYERHKSAISKARNEIAKMRLKTGLRLSHYT